MEPDNSTFKTYFFNALVLSPAIFMLLLGLYYSIPSMNPYMYAPIFALPAIKRLSPKLVRLNLYRIVLIIFLLLLIDSFLSRISGPLPVVGGIGVPLTFTTFFTLEICLGYLLVVEGFFTKKAFYVVGALISSIASLGELYAAIALMNSPYFGTFQTIYQPTLNQFGLAGVPAIQLALISVAVFQYLALYSLVVNGFMTFMPLYSIPLPYPDLLLALFAVSFIGVVGRFYVGGEKDESFRLEGLFYSVILGVIISFLVIEFAVLFQGNDFQFLVISVLMIVFLAASVASSRLSPKERYTTE